MVQQTSCVKCANQSARRPEYDSFDTLDSFKAYYCKIYKGIIHDYYSECKFFSQKETGNLK